jgi:hypothetical protein
MPLSLDTPIQRPLAALALAAVLLNCGGCLMQPNISAKVVTVDGQTVEVPLNTVAVPVTDDVVTINTLQFSPWVVPDKPRQITLSSIIKFKEGAVPTHIVIEDVTDDPIEEIINEPSPKIVKDGLIGIISRPYLPDDDHVKWVLTLDNNVRVYRYTVTLKDGSTHVLYRGVFIPAQMKNLMRFQLGIPPG